MISKIKRSHGIERNNWKPQFCFKNWMCKTVWNLRGELKIIKHGNSCWLSWVDLCWWPDFYSLLLAASPLVCQCKWFSQIWWGYFCLLNLRVMWLFNWDIKLQHMSFNEWVDGRGSPGNWIISRPLRALVNRSQPFFHYFSLKQCN